MESNQVQSEGKGLIRGIFDFSFDRFVTLTFIRFIYGLLLLGWGLGWVVFLISTLANDIYGTVAKILLILVVLPIGGVLSLVYLRMLMELMVVQFKIAQNTTEIRDIALRAFPASGDVAPSVTPPTE